MGARGLLKLMPPLMLMPMPTTPMVDSMVDTMVDSEPTAMEPILIPMVPTPTPMVDTEPTATASGNSAKPNQRLISNNQIKSIHEPALRGFEVLRSTTELFSA